MRLLVSAGEPSGELYAAEMLRCLREDLPSLEVFGLGGDHLARAGGRLLAHVRDTAVVGLLEVVRHLPRFRRLFHEVLAEVARDPPRAAVLVDYPGFNLRLARALHARGVPVVYYVSPQVWAWKRGRVRALRETVARMLVIFPFEEPLYRAEGVPVTFVGHPLVDLVKPAPDRAAFLRGLGLDPDRPVLALLPGSRRKEVEHHLPTLREAVRRLREERPALQFVLAAASSLDPGSLRARAGDCVSVVSGRAHEVLSVCTAAVLASGTATVEAALLGAPMVVVYRLSPVTWALGRRLVRVPHVAMANLIAERRLVPELIQSDFTAEAVVGETLALLDDAEKRAAVRAGLDEVRRRLGGGGASARAARAVADVLHGRSAGP
jgi:lipid-A-disaccharide synthase